MFTVVPRLCLIPACLSVALLSACANRNGLSYLASAQTQLADYALEGDTGPVHDPSIIRQGARYYAFTSDEPGAKAGLAIRCSSDRVVWAACGGVFSQTPQWVRDKVPGVGALWAPDIAFFNGLYHVYYAGSTQGSQRSVIGLATNTTLDPGDPAYSWVDGGEVLESQPGMDFNAIDPNILVDQDGSVWLTYGSYWSGIKQMQIDAKTGLIMPGAPRYDLATRPWVSGNPIEGASVVQHGGFYYLFVSVDHCCESSLADDDYKEAMGRGTTPHGPFAAMDGTPMLLGGGTVILEGNGNWVAPGGGTAHIDPASGEAVLTFHALNVQENGAMHLWVKGIEWVDDWPLLVE
jgi:arabinan endo-1,5-alpha-L-arabinosidase